MAAQRARDISSGSPLTVEKDNDKNPVVALREIAEETIVLDELRESLISSLQMRVESDDLDEDEIDMLGMEREAELVIEDNKVSVSTINENKPNEIDIE